MDEEILKAIAPYARDYIRLEKEMNELCREKDIRIKVLEEHISLLKDEERMHLRMVEQSNEISRLHRRISDAKNDVIGAAKLLIDPYTEDLSKVEFPMDGDGIKTGENDVR